VPDSKPAIDATRLDLAREFRRNPFAKHSPELYALLEVLRGPAWNGNYVLVVLEPYRRYALAVKQPGGKPPVVLSNEIHASAAVQAPLGGRVRPEARDRVRAAP